MAARSRAAVGVAALLGVSLSLGLAFAGQPGQQSIHDGVFTPEQVQAGEELYVAICSECHSKDTFGPDYMVGWSGASVGELFEQLQATMPYENPGALEDKQYTDVLVYIFNLNGVAAGEVEMPSEVEKLNEISIDGPFKWNGYEH